MNHLPLFKMPPVRNTREVCIKVISQQNKAWRNAWMGKFALNIKKE